MVGAVAAVLAHPTPELRELQNERVTEQALIHQVGVEGEESTVEGRHQLRIPTVDRILAGVGVVAASLHPVDLGADADRDRAGHRLQRGPKPGVRVGRRRRVVGDRGNPLQRRERGLGRRIDE